MAELARLRAENEQLRARLQRLEAENARLRKDSSTSSKPPSSDIVKPPKPPTAPGRKRHIGGQPGHPRHQRAALPTTAVDRTVSYGLGQCPACGGALTPCNEPMRVVQQFELVAKPVVVTEHRALAFWCPHCRTTHYAALPPGVAEAGLVGPCLTACVAYLKGACHGSYTTIQTHLRDALGVSLSTGQLVKLVGKASAALAGPYQELLEQLPRQAVLNVDETGHKDAGESYWTWCFRAALFTLFKIDPSRGSAVLLEVLGKDFDGVLGCDYFSAYRKYMKDCDILVQFYLAHLIRDVKFLLTLQDRATRRYGERLLKALRSLFGVIHRREHYTPPGFERALDRARRRVLSVGRRAPRRAEALNLAQRFRQHGTAYFQFITTPGIEPTNNLAERAIRFVVIDRRVTQGTRGQAGRIWCERIWTTIATCAQQGRSVFEFLQQAVHAHLTGHPVPSLLFNTS